MTTLTGPYDKIPLYQKHRIQANIPERVYQRLFYEILSRRGVQDRLIGIFVNFLDKNSDKFIRKNTQETEKALINFLKEKFDSSELSMDYNKTENQHTPDANMPPMRTRKN